MEQKFIDNNGNKSDVVLKSTLSEVSSMKRILTFSPLHEGKTESLIKRVKDSM